MKKSNLFLACSYAFIIAFICSFIIFSPKVYAEGLSDFSTRINDQILRNNDVPYFNNNCSNAIFYTVDKNSPSDTSTLCFILLDKTFTNLSNWDTSKYTSNLRGFSHVYCWGYNYNKGWSSNNAFWNTNVTNDFVVSNNSSIFALYDIEINGVTIPAFTDINDYLDNPPLPSIPDDINAIPSVPNEDIIKYCIYQVGSEIKLVTFTQPTDLYVADNDLLSWWFKGYTTYTIYDMYYNFNTNSFQWDLLNSEDFIGSSTPTYLANIGLYPTDFTYIRSNYDIKVFNYPNKDIIKIYYAKDPTLPSVPSDKDNDIPQTGFTPDALPSGFTDRFDIDTDINFNEYVYWVYGDVGAGHTMYASNYPLRYYWNGNGAYTPQLVRTKDILNDIKVKQLNWDDNVTDFKQIFDYTLTSYNKWLNSSIGYDYRLSNLQSNYNIMNAIVDDDSSYILKDDNSIFTQQTITWGGGSYTDDDPNGTSSDIWTTIKSYLTTWFVPSSNPFDSLFTKLQNKFNYTYYKDFFDSILNTTYSDTDVPTFTIDFSSSNYYGFNGSVNILDLSWVSPYISTIKTILSISIYLFTIIWLFKRIPRLLGGFY